MINTKLYVDILSRQAKKDGRPHEMALSDLTSFLICSAWRHSRAKVQTA